MLLWKVLVLNLFSSGSPGNVEKYFFVNSNLEVLISGSENANVITVSFKSYSELVSFSHEIQNRST